jgi:hypothetical protein
MRTFIITAVLAGVAAAITGGVVGFSNTAATEAKKVFGVTNTSVASSGVSQAGPVIATQVSQGFSDCYGGSGWVFPQSASAAFTKSPLNGPTRDGQTWASDPSAWGAVEASDIQLQMVVSDNSPDPVVLTGIRVDVSRREPAIKGTTVNIEPNPCAPATFQIGTIDLDTSPPSWVLPGTPVGNAESISTAPIRFPYVVSQSSPLPLVLTITTQHCDCAWTLGVDWADGGKFGSSSVTDNGHPFQTTASANLPWIVWGSGYENQPWQIVQSSKLTATTGAAHRREPQL